MAARQLIEVDQVVEFCLFDTSMCSFALLPVEGDEFCIVCKVKETFLYGNWRNSRRTGEAASNLPCSHIVQFAS